MALQRLKILVLNSGSSSLKSSLYQISRNLADVAPEPAWEGELEFGRNQSTLKVRTSGSKPIESSVAGSRREATVQLLSQLCSGPRAVLNSAAEADVVGHRIVNGGPEYKEPTLLTPKVKTAIKSAAAFAPLHNRTELEDIDIVEQAFGAVRQVAVFDTGFHKDLPEAAAVYPGRYDWVEKGIRRYGFHGISHEYCAGRCAQLLGRKLESLKVVTCHLGNGCSLAAVRDGHSVDTTMGFTPLEGLMMGTRSGSIDPGILTYLMRRDSLTAEKLDNLLNRESGLLGISGISGDMREIVAAMNRGNARARLAFDIFVHRLRAGIGSMVATLGGLDVLAFTGGIGENSAEVRSAACAELEFLGVRLDPAKNEQQQGDRDVSDSGGVVRVFVVHAQENWAIARACWKLAS